MAYDDLEEIVNSIRSVSSSVAQEEAEEEAGLGPRRQGTKPPWARFFSGAGWADAIGASVRRGGETLVSEATAPLRDIPEGVSSAVEAMQEPSEGTVLGRLRQLGKVGLGGAQAGISVARTAFSPVSAALRTATEFPLLLAERPDQPRPENAETMRKVAQFAGEGAIGVGAVRALAKLRGAAAARQVAEVKPTPAGQDTEGRILTGRFREPLALPERGVGPEPERVFKVGPPGSVTGKPTQVYDPALRMPGPKGGIVKGITPRKPTTPDTTDVEVVGLPRGGRFKGDQDVRLEGESTLDALRRRADKASEDVVSIADDVIKQDLKGMSTKRPEETLGQAIRRQVRERQAAGAGLPESEPSVKEYFPTGMPPGMSMRDRVKLHSKDELRKVRQAAVELTDDELDATPPHIQQAVRSGGIDPDPNRPDWLSKFFTQVKIRLPLSMTQVSKGDPVFSRIVQMINGANDTVQAMRDDWAMRLRDIAKRVSKQDFEAGIRARDRHLPPANANQGQVMTLFGEISDAWAKALSLDPSHPDFITNYVPRLRQAFKIVKTEIQAADDWVSTDVLKHFPSDFKPYFTKHRKLALPGERYDIDTMIAHSNAVARAAVYGTPQHQGLLRDLEPLLAQLKDRPANVQNYIANYINHAIGHPAFRSSEGAQQLGNMVRSFEFMRTIGANVTSPIYNSLQRVLTHTEVSTKSALQALADEIGYYRGNPELVALIKKAKIPTESLGPHKLETETFTGAASDLMTKTRDILAKPFGYAERGNRVHAFFAGYRDALSKGMAEDDAIQAGKDLIQKTQFMPGPGDKPVWMRKELGATVGQFKYFQTKLGEYMWNNFADMFKRGPAFSMERARAAKKFVKFWATSYALGGPQVMPVIGEWLEKHDPIGLKGLGPTLGVAITDQLGTGAVLPKDLASLKYYLPGPVINHIRDVTTALGFDPFDPQVPPSVADKMRSAVRAFPIAGVQLERVRRGMLVDAEGNERVPQTAREAFFGFEPIPSQRPVLRRDVGRVGRMIGLTDPEQEKEYRMMSKLNKANIIKNQAINQATQAELVGDYDGAREILREAERKLDLPLGRLSISRQSRRAAKEAAILTPLERRRKASGKALRDYGLEDTLP